MNMRHLLVLIIFSIISLVSLANEEATYRNQDYTIEMDGWTSQALLTLPSEPSEPVPVVILFHGSGPYDMDATTLTTEGDILSRNFLTIAETLSDAGYSVLRFNKRGVHALGEYDTGQIQATTLDTLIADANVVIDFAFTLPEIDKENVFLYGWSEGAWVIANVATMRNDIAGLILQGAPNGSLADILPYQYQELALPYLRNMVDTDSDGILSLDDVADIPAGAVQLMVPFFFYEPGSPEDAPITNRFVDENGDGLIHIDDELEPAIALFLQNMGRFQPPIDARTATAGLVAEANIPTLLLHGEQDGWVPVSNSQAIQETAPDIVTLNTYPELGHALSVTEILAEDGFYPIADAPLADIVDWLNVLRSR